MSPRAKKLKRVAQARRKMRDMAAGALAGAEQEADAARALEREVRATLHALYESSVDKMGAGVGLDALWRFEASRTMVEEGLEAARSQVASREAEADTRREALRSRAGEYRRTEKILEAQMAADAYKHARDEQKQSDDRVAGRSDDDGEDVP